MSVIHYAVEVDTETTAAQTSVGLTYGYLRYTTDRPLYTGTDTGSAVIPTGDCSVIKINLNGTESIGTAFQSGQLYAASNGIFKTANTVLAVGDRFTVQDASDFTPVASLAAAKGSAPAEGDMFEVTNNGSGTEAVKYVGINKWYEDFITRDGMSNPSRSVDLEGSGDYGTLSGFTFTVNDCFVAGNNPFWELLYNAGVTLANKRVRVYVSIDDVFYQIWAGVVENDPRSDTEFEFSCKPNIKRVHKDLPRTVINRTAYPNCTDDSNGKPVPVALGDIEYAKVMNLSGAPDWIDVLTISGVNYSGVMAYAYDPILGGYTLKTVDKVFATNGLAGKYLFPVSGGGPIDTDRGVRIRGNIASGSGYTVIYLDEVLLGTDGLQFDITKYGYSGTEAQQDKWIFGIATLPVVGCVGSSEISSFKTSNNTPYLFAYDRERETYDDISYIGDGIDISNSNYDNLPTISAKSSSLKKSGDVKYAYPVKFQITSLSVGHGGYGAGTNADIQDMSRATYREFMTGYSAASTGGKNYFRSFVEMAGALKTLSQDANVDKLYCGVDLYLPGTPAPDPEFTVYLYLKVKDMYGNTISTWPLTFQKVLTYNTEFNIMPTGYYQVSGGGNGEGSIFDIAYGTPATVTQLQAEVDEDFLNFLLTSSSQESAYGNPFTLELHVSHLEDVAWGFSLRTWRLKEVGFFALRSSSITGANLYARISGEKLAAGTETNTVYTALRHILETYDGLTSAEIDYGNLATKRHSLTNYKWYVGRQITDKKNSADYISELCKQSFVAGFQNRRGKIAFSAWRDSTESTFALTPVRDGIGSWKLNSIDRAYDTFTLNYSADPGGDKYFSSHQVLNVDSGTVPTQYAGTIIEPIWDICRAAYLIYKSIKEFKLDLSWFNDRTRWYNSTDAMDGIGSDGSAFKFLEHAAYWMTRQKRMAEVTIPVTTANVLVELCRPVSLADSIYTSGVTTYGYAHMIEYDIKRDCINVGAIFNPYDTIDDDFGDIIETGTAPDTITESGSQPDTITETGV